MLCCASCGRECHCQCQRGVVLLLLLPFFPGGLSLLSRPAHLRLCVRWPPSPQGRAAPDPPAHARLRPAVLVVPVARHPQARARTTPGVHRLCHRGAHRWVGVQGCLWAGGWVGGRAGLMLSTFLLELLSSVFLRSCLEAQQATDPASKPSQRRGSMWQAAHYVRVGSPRLLPAHTCCVAHERWPPPPRPFSYLLQRQFLHM